MQSQVGLKRPKGIMKLHLVFNIIVVACSISSEDDVTIITYF